MKGLILDRNKYIVERSKYNSFIRLVSIFMVLVFSISVVVLLSIVNTNRKTSANGTTKNEPFQYVVSDEDENLKSNERKDLDDGSSFAINKKREGDDVQIVKKDISESYFVTKVVDGDTIYVSGIKTRIRLIGIDTPEIHNGPVQCYGPEASDYLTGLILGKYVGLESDAASGDVDIYGRPLRYVYYNGENVNQKILLEGYGKEASYGSEYKYRSQFIKSEQDAIASNKGLWSPSTCNGEE